MGNTALNYLSYLSKSYFLIKVVLKAVSIDKKISTKESWHSKAEKKTFEINDNFGKQDETSKSSKPFEKFSVCQ